MDNATLRAQISRLQGIEDHLSQAVSDLKATTGLGMIPPSALIRGLGSNNNFYEEPAAVVERVRRHVSSVLDGLYAREAREARAVRGNAEGKAV